MLLPDLVAMTKTFLSSYMKHSHHTEECRWCGKQLGDLSDMAWEPIFYKGTVIILCDTCAHVVINQLTVWLLEKGEREGDVNNTQLEHEEVGVVENVGVGEVLRRSSDQKVLCHQPPPTSAMRHHERPKKLYAPPTIALRKRHHVSSSSHQRVINSPPPPVVHGSCEGCQWDVEGATCNLCHDYSLWKAPIDYVELTTRTDCPVKLRGDVPEQTRSVRSTERHITYLCPECQNDNQSLFSHVRNLDTGKEMVKCMKCLHGAI